MSRTATSWCSGWASPFTLTAFCHLQKLRRVLSAWWVIFRSSYKMESRSSLIWKHLYHALTCKAPPRLYREREDRLLP